jgi:uncharacterized protein
MERESFENPEIASFLNRHYVSIKVDLEERPDLDDLYMSAVQLIGGQGGWPMSVWLTPELKPFYGGTYFPPGDAHGRPGFLRVLQALLEVYRNRRAEVESSASLITERIAAFADLPPGSAPLTNEPIRAAAGALLDSFDPEYGGFGGAPKFPQAAGLQLLLRQEGNGANAAALRAVRLSLDGMARGGIYDHLGGGFHRYSTDARWLAPHFEKMLYDQALLSPAYLEAFLVTGEADYACVVRETLDYVLREMRSPEGGFYSTQDADSEGVEGRFYLWTPREIQEVLGKERAALFCRAYGVDEAGNFEGGSILHRPEPWPELARATGSDPVALEEILRPARVALRRRREMRVHPFRDEKILLSWNGLMLAALAQAAWVLDEERYLNAARDAARFLLTHMRREGRLFHVYKDGRIHTPAFLEDLAGLIGGLVSLHQATFEAVWLKEAEGLAEAMLRDFSDPGQGGFYNTSPQHTHLITRPRNAQDGSTPSGNSLAAHVLLRLGRLLDRADLIAAGERTLRAFFPLMERAPLAFPQMLLALDLSLEPRQEIVILGRPEEAGTRAFLEVLRGRFMPHALLLCGGNPAGDGSPLAAGKTRLRGEPTAFLCSGSACQAPVTRAEDLRALLDRFLEPA